MIRLLSLFSGIGAFEKALENLGVDFEIVNYCEIDKFASKAYSLIHNVPEEKNLGDITKVDETKLPKDIDLVVYGFPCQDISIAGRKKGFVDEEGNKTRSGLFFDALRIIEAVQPEVAIAENVKNLVSMKDTFELVLNSLRKTGYVNHWDILNAKDYTIPQNRERVFIVSFRYDCYHGFHFPMKHILRTVLKDFLEKDVPESYDLSQDAIKYMDRQVRGGEKPLGFPPLSGFRKGNSELLDCEYV